MTELAIKKDENGYERLVFAEVLIPDTPNVYGDFHTKESIRQFAYGFMIQSFELDIEHDNEEWYGKLHVVESFIARSGDPDFIEGSWVVGMYIPDDDLWARVLSNDLNGFSWDAFISYSEATINLPGRRIRVGFTEPGGTDGHTHSFFVVVDDDGRPALGGTSFVSGHTHSVSSHTKTDENLGHSHLYNYVTPGDL